MQIALDPWGSDYSSQVATPHDMDSEETTVQALEEPIEDGPWQPRHPQPLTLPQLTAVIDGVMRSDARAMVTQDDIRFLGLFCSHATGAVVVEQPVERIERVEIVEMQVQRLFITGSGQSGPDAVQVPAGTSTPLTYVSHSSPATTPDKLSEALINEMRQAESKIAEKLSGPDGLILADGNLTYVGGSSSVVGVIKSIYRMYLSTKRTKILERLEPGQRTPLFRIQGGNKRESYDVFSCYLRLTQPRRIEHVFTGLVRLEVKASLGPDKAVALLDQAAVKVFELASRAPKDPRAPQNLLPVGGLERQLRRRLGDPKLVRRGIEKALLHGLNGL
jgi:hypothetical protein